VNPSEQVSKIQEVAEVIAIVSIVSGAAVAITVPFINARLERSRRELQGREARFEELRVLLDDAVQHLYTAWTILYEIEQEAQQGLPRPQSAYKHLVQHGTDLTSQVDVLIQDGLRLTLRTPPGSALKSAHAEAQQACTQYELEYRQFLGSELVDQERPPRPPSIELSNAIALFMDEIRDFVGVALPADQRASPVAPSVPPSSSS
jgi:hypothetical protein